jgi:signal transduction histidine kinase
MKIRTRTHLILIATLVVFLIVLSFITQLVIIQAFGEIEKQETTSHVQRFVSQIDYAIEDVAVSCRDWALRDETKEIFMDDWGKSDPSQPFQPVSMKNLGIDYIMIYSTSGNRIFSETITKEGGVVQSIPPELDIIVHNSIIPEGMQGGISGRRGLSSINNNPVILVGYPVVYGNQSDPREGTLVMARLLDRDRIDEINRMLQMDGSLTQYTPGTGDGIISEQEYVAAKEGAIIVQQSGDNQLKGYALITGIENKPTYLLLKIETTRPVHQQVWNSIVIVAGIIILLSIIYLFVVQHLLRKFILTPLSELDTGMKSLSESGDLSLRMSETGDEEVISLIQSLNLMLETIQSQQQELHALLEEIEQQRDDLQDAREELAKRNRDLEELNRKANLYLDIYLDAITYEILNAIMGLRGYAELVQSTADETERKFAEKIIHLAKKSDDVIRNIETISRIYKNPPEIKCVDLASIVKKEMGSRMGAHIIMEQCNRSVLANDMLGVVFDNIFSNSLKFGGKDTTITVSAREIPQDMVEITVSDNGPGIPDTLKPLIFDRFTQDTRIRSSYGLGLHIVKMLVESYGGNIWAEDRIPGEQQSGAVIRFTLRLIRAQLLTSKTK